MDSSSGATTSTLARGQGSSGSEGGKCGAIGLGNHLHRGAGLGLILALLRLDTQFDLLEAETRLLGVPRLCAPHCTPLTY